MERPGCIKRAVKYLVECRTVGAGEAGRRAKEYREDKRIRKERNRPVLLTEKEKKRQAAEHFSRETVFRVVFLKNGRPENPPV